MNIVFSNEELKFEFVLDLGFYLHGKFTIDEEKYEFKLTFFFLDVYENDFSKKPFLNSSLVFIKNNHCVSDEISLKKVLYESRRVNQVNNYLSCRTHDELIRKHIYCYDLQQKLVDRLSDVSERAIHKDVFRRRGL